MSIVLKILDGHIVDASWTAPSERRITNLSFGKDGRGVAGSPSRCQGKAPAARGRLRSFMMKRPDGGSSRLRQFWAVEAWRSLHTTENSAGSLAERTLLNEAPQDGESHCNRSDVKEQVT